MINSIILNSRPIIRAFEHEAQRLINAGLSMITIEGFRKVVVLHAMKHTEAETISWLKALSRRISDNRSRALGRF